MSRTLSAAEVQRLVYGYIGVSGGYLGDFSRAQAAELLVDAGVEIDLSDIPGTTREMFLAAVRASPPSVQANIVEAVLARYPVYSADRRTPEVRREIEALVQQLRGAAAVATPDLQFTVEVVERALADAEALFASSGPTSAFDRVHTALHGYLRAVAKEAGLSLARDASATDIFKLLRESHPAFAEPGPRGADVARAIQAMATVVDALTPLRNRASIAHANESLLRPVDAMGAINAAKTVLHYVDGVTRDFEARRK